MRGHTDGPKTVPMVPRPIQTLVTDLEDDGRAYFGVTRRFSNAQGLACRLCEACSFKPGIDGQGVCHQVFRGRIGARDPETIAHRPSSYGPGPGPGPRAA